jgi:hypothetical protein
MVKRLKQTNRRLRDMIEDQNTFEEMDKEITRISREGIDSLWAFIKDQNTNYPVSMSVLMNISASILVISIQSIDDINILQAFKKEFLEITIFLFDNAEEKLKQKMN